MFFENDSFMKNSFILKGNVCQTKNPNDYKPDNIITYQWNQTGENNPRGRFNFYYDLGEKSVKGSSMLLYMVLFMLIAVAGEILGRFCQEPARLAVGGM